MMEFSAAPRQRQVREGKKSVESFSLGIFREEAAAAAGKQS